MGFLVNFFFLYTDRKNTLKYLLALVWCSLSVLEYFWIFYIYLLGILFLCTLAVS